MRQNHTTMYLLSPIRAGTAMALLSALHCHAITCDELRPEVEARIRAGGVTQFSVTVAEAVEPSAGKVVGACDHGAKKLIYLPGVPPLKPMMTPVVKPTAAPRVAPAESLKKNEQIVTECKDGSVSLQGDCKK
jgi:hypothetical protein